MTTSGSASCGGAGAAAVSAELTAPMVYTPAMPSLEELEAVARGAAPAPLDAADRERIAAGRAVVEAALEAGTAVYGVTTGFGQLESVRIAPADAAQLQVNLVRSHAVGAGPPLPEEVVRGMLLLLASSLRRGHSGVRVELVELVLALLERGVTPVIPSKGSVGSSGDLAPLAHLGLVLIGEGEATVAGADAPRRRGARRAPAWSRSRCPPRRGWRSSTART